MKRTAIAFIPVALLLWLTGALVLDQHFARLNASLIHAVNNHDAPGVDRLLAQGADPNTRNWNTYYGGGSSPFRPPWYEKYLAKLMHRRPRTADSYLGPTVLMIAAHQGDKTVAQSLLKCGADITKTGTEPEVEDDSPNRAVVPPLWEAVKGEDASLVKMLIKWGAPVNIRVKGLTPLMMADDLGAATALIDGGADVNAVADSNAEDNEGSTPLIFAMETPFPLQRYTDDLSGAQRIAMMCLLLKRGANINGTAASRQIPLSLAAVNGSYGYVRLLLAQGADPNVRDQNGDTALIAVAANGGECSLTCMRLLLSHGAGVNAQNKNGQTALMLVSHIDYADEEPDWREARRTRMRLLRQFGADTRLKDKQGKTAVDYFNANPPDGPGS